MRQIDKKERYLEAQELFEERKKLMETEGNEARIKSCWNEIFVILYEIISVPLDGISLDEEIALGDKDVKTISYIMKTYDSERGPLENFANYTWARRKNGEEIEIDQISINEPVGEDGATLEDYIIPDTYEEHTPQARETIRNRFVDLIYIADDINKLYMNKHSIKNANLRLVFTDRMTDICKNEIDDINIPAILRRQKSIMNGMDLDFLDFYMTAICRNLKDIQATDLKKWRDIPFSNKVIEKENTFAKSPALPLQNKIYMCFFWSKDESKSQNSIGSSISQCKRNYTELLKKLGLKSFIADINSLRKTHNMEEESEKRIPRDSPLRNIMMDYISNIPERGWENLEAVQAGLYLKINEVMSEKCGKIKTCYESLKNEETALIEQYKRNIAELSINKFIEAWQNNFAEKYSYYIKRKRVEKHVPDYIKNLALPKIRDRITQNETDIQMVLNSLDDDFAEKKQLGNITICNNIEQLAVKEAKSAIIRRIAKQESINQVIVEDTIRAIEESDSSSLKKIVEKVQDDNLHRYYWM